MKKLLALLLGLTMLMSLAIPMAAAEGDAVTLRIACWDLNTTAYYDAIKELKFCLIKCKL